AVALPQGPMPVTVRRTVAWPVQPPEKQTIGLKTLAFGMKPMQAGDGWLTMVQCGVPPVPLPLTGPKQVGESGPVWHFVDPSGAAAAVAVGRAGAVGSPSAVSVSPPQGPVPVTVKRTVAVPVQPSAKQTVGVNESGPVPVKLTQPGVGSLTTVHMGVP